MSQPAEFEDLVYELNIKRLLVYSEWQRETRDAKWTVRLGHDSDGSHVLLGELSVAAEFGRARALAAGFINHLSEPDSVSYSSKSLETWVRNHCLAELYSIAKRAILSQAATMELKLELPNSLPETTIELVELDSANIKGLEEE